MICVFPFCTKGKAIGVLEDVWPSLDVVAFAVLEFRKYIAGANISPIANYI